MITPGMMLISETHLYRVGHNHRKQWLLEYATEPHTWAEVPRTFRNPHELFKYLQGEPVYMLVPSPLN